MWSVGHTEHTGLRRCFGIMASACVIFAVETILAFTRRGIARPSLHRVWLVEGSHQPLVPFGHVFGLKAFAVWWPAGPKVSSQCMPEGVLRMLARQRSCAWLLPGSHKAG